MKNKRNQGISLNKPRVVSQTTAQAVSEKPAREGSAQPIIPHESTNQQEPREQYAAAIQALRGILEDFKKSYSGHPH